MELENMTSQAAQDLEDDEHATKSRETREHQLIEERLESYLDIPHEPRRCARRKRDSRTSTRQLHDHDHDHLHDTTTKGWRFGGSSPWMSHHPSGSRQGHPRYTRYDGRPWVARPHVQSAKRLPMPHHENTTNERCSDKHGSGARDDREHGQADLPARPVVLKRRTQTQAPTIRRCRS